MAAQQKWSLDDCVTYALQHNLQLNDFKFNERSDRETYRQSIRNLLPSVNGATNYVVNFGRSTDPFTNDVVTTDFFSNNYSLESSVDLFQGFQKLHSIQASKFLFKATKEEVLQQKYLLAFRVMQAFYDIQFFEGLGRHIQRTVGGLPKQFRSGEKTNRTGSEGRGRSLMRPNRFYSRIN